MVMPPIDDYLEDGLCCLWHWLYHKMMLNDWTDVRIWTLFVSGSATDNPTWYREWLTGAKRREWMGMGVAGMIITSDDMDHSRKFPA